jgi:hypothetical protein
MAFDNTTTSAAENDDATNPANVNATTATNGTTNPAAENNDDTNTASSASTDNISTNNTSIVDTDTDTDTEEEENDDGDGEEDDLEIPIPKAIEAMIDNPPILPSESKEDFVRVYDDFLESLDPETVPQHWLVWNATVLTWEDMRYRRMKVAYMLNQRRATVSILIRKAFQATAMCAVRKLGSDIDANIERYFTDPAYPPLIAQALAKSGYSIDVVEAEMFARSLDGLSRIEKLIASAEKRLMLFFREMDGNRAVRAQRIANDRLSQEDS